MESRKRRRRRGIGWAPTVILLVGVLVGLLLMAAAIIGDLKGAASQRATPEEVEMVPL